MLKSYNTIPQQPQHQPWRALGGSGRHICQGNCRYVVLGLESPCLTTPSNEAPWQRKAPESYVSTRAQKSHAIGQTPVFTQPAAMLRLAHEPRDDKQEKRSGTTCDERHGDSNSDPGSLQTKRQSSAVPEHENTPPSDDVPCSRGLNSPAMPVLASAWTGLSEAAHANPRPAGPQVFWEPAWSGLGRLAGGANEGDLRGVRFQVLDYNERVITSITTTTDRKFYTPGQAPQR